MFITFKKSIFGIGMNFGWLPPSLRPKNVLLEFVGSKPQGTHAVLLALPLTFHMSWICEFSLGTGDFVHSSLFLPFIIWVVPY